MLEKVEVANSQNRERSSINISRRTKDDLDSIKHSGQSYDGLIQELVKFWKDKNWPETKTSIKVPA